MSTESTEHFGVTAAPFRIRSRDAGAHFISFVGPNGEVGYLDWEEGQLTFGGDMAESARIFLSCLRPLVKMAAQAMREDDECKRRP